MKLYFAPLACSLASRIALYEAAADATYTLVDLKSKRLPDGSDFRSINPLGLVPALGTDDGDVLTENPVVLQYIAERFPAAQLFGRGQGERYRLQQWLSFIGSELHKGVFIPLLDPASPEGAKQFATGKAAPRLDYVDQQLAGRAYLLSGFSVADAYLATVLNWAVAIKFDLSQWPHIKAQRAHGAAAERRESSDRRACALC